MRTPGVPFVAAALLAVACQTTNTVPPTEGVSAREGLAATAGLAYDSAWDYLRDKYDSNGDNTIARDEYDRDPESFGNLDKDSDGAITAADFATSSGMPPEQMQRMIASRVLMLALQHDDDTQALARDELEPAFAGLDTDADGLLVREECADIDVGTMAPMLRMADTTPFDALTGQADDNGDGKLALHELHALFGRFDEDGNGVLEQRARGRGRSRGAPEDNGALGEAGSPDAPAAHGKRAPDFTLQPPDGGTAVTLSSFIGKRPVALIFGSYT